MTALGIDFGTSTSVLSVCHLGGDVEAIPDAEGDEVVPSIVAFTPAKEVLVGRPARQRRLIDPRNCLFSVKRVIGRGWHSQERKRFDADYPFELEEGKDGQPRFVTRLGKLTATEVVGYLLAHLRTYPGVASKRIDGVVVSVPASASDEQKGATLEAVARAGFGQATVIEEPHAAALPYIREQPPGRTVVVYDLGGGTFDVAVMVWDGRTLETRAFGGDSYLGGDDVDQRLTARLADRILEQYRWDVRSNLVSQQTLRLLCEQAKIRLSLHQRTPLSLGPVDQVLGGKIITVGQEEVEELCADLLQRTFVLCDDVIRRAGISVAEVDSVIVAGGGAYIPAVRRGVQAYFGQRPRGELAPDRVVALGAALYAERLARA